MVEKPKQEEAPSRHAIIGRYILTPQIFDVLEKTPLGAGGELQLTDGIRGLLQYEKVYGYSFDGLRFDAGDKLGMLKATVEFGLNHTELGALSRVSEDFVVLIGEKEWHILELCRHYKGEGDASMIVVLLGQKASAQQRLSMEVLPSPLSSRAKPRESPCGFAYLKG